MSNFNDGISTKPSGRGIACPNPSSRADNSRRRPKDIQPAVLSLSDQRNLLPDCLQKHIGSHTQHPLQSEHHLAKCIWHQDHCSFDFCLEQYLLQLFLSGVCSYIDYDVPTAGNRAERYKGSDPLLPYECFWKEKWTFLQFQLLEDTGKFLCFSKLCGSDSQLPRLRGHRTLKSAPLYVVPKTDHQRYNQCAQLHI